MIDKRKQIFKHSVIVGITLLVVIVIINIFSFFSVNADQFNIFHRYDQVHTLETWNLPFNADVDVDLDGQKDFITFTGCAYLTTRKSDSLSKEKQCDIDIIRETTVREKGIKVFGYNGPKRKILLSYLGRKENEMWNIIVVKKFNTELYEIRSNGSILEKEPPLPLKIDSLLYGLSHIFFM